MIEKLLLLGIISIQFMSLNGDIASEIMKETFEEQHTEELAELEFDKILSQDAQMATEAENEAKIRQHRKQTKTSDGRHKAAGFRGPQGVSDMMKKRDLRENLVNSDRRSRVPESSRPGSGATNNHRENNLDTFTFEEYAASMQGNQGVISQRDGFVDEEAAEEQVRKASRDLLDVPTAQLQHRHVLRILKASGGGRSVYGDKGGGDWYQVLGVKKGEDDVNVIKRQVCCYVMFSCSLFLFRWFQHFLISC